MVSSDRFNFILQTIKTITLFFRPPLGTLYFYFPPNQNWLTQSFHTFAVAKSAPLFLVRVSFRHVLSYLPRKKISPPVNMYAFANIKSREINNCDPRSFAARRVRNLILFGSQPDYSSWLPSAVSVFFLGVYILQSINRIVCAIKEHAKAATGYSLT